MEEVIVNTMNVLDKVEDTFDNIVDIVEELDTAKLTIDMYPDKTSLTEKARIYRKSLLKFATKKCILSAFCTFIVIPISFAFLKAGGVSPVLSLVILLYMTKKSTPIILEEAGFL